MPNRPPYCQRCEKYPDDCDEETRQECLDAYINYEDNIKEDLKNDE